MILFADNRRFTIAGAHLVRAGETISLNTITTGSRPSEFPLATTGVTPPIIYVNLAIEEQGTILAAMSLKEFNTIALAQSKATLVKVPMPMPFAQRAIQRLGRVCGGCGKR